MFFTGHSSGKIGEWEVRVDAGKTVHATCKEERDVQGITVSVHSTVRNNK